MVRSGIKETEKTVLRWRTDDGGTWSLWARLVRMASRTLESSASRSWASSRDCVWYVSMAVEIVIRSVDCEDSLPLFTNSLKAETA